MKELSIEQKARAYDEAIEKFKPIYDLAKKENRTIDVKEFEDIFPELKESEDERIRQFLIQEVTGTSDEIMSYRNMNKKDVLAWLEKQGKQKQEANYSKFDFNDVLALQCCMETAKEVQEDKELYEQLQSLHNRLYDAYQLEKQGEQKPAWSEEDIVAIDCAVEVLSKDLPSLAASIERLKSLKDRYTWKPSDKQMKALKEAVDEHWEPDGLDPLYTLYQNLKKLKG